MDRRRLLGRQLVAATALLWAGVVVGVSFIATPAKFSAPSLSLPTAIEVGRVTFGVLHLWEGAFAIVLIGLLAWHRPPRLTTAVAAAAVIIVAIQVFAIMPALAPASDAVISGGGATRSWLHRGFIVLEAAKVGILVATATLVTRRPRESL